MIYNVRVQFNKYLHFRLNIKNNKRNKNKGPDLQCKFWSFRTNTLSFPIKVIWYLTILNFWVSWDNTNLELGMSGLSNSWNDKHLSINKKLSFFDSVYLAWKMRRLYFYFWHPRQAQSKPRILKYECNLLLVIFPCGGVSV